MWPIIGAALGLSPAAGEAGLPPRCRSVVAHRLLLLYNNVLRQFDEECVQEEIVAAKRLINEKKRKAFALG